MGCDIHAAVELKGVRGWVALTFPNKWYGKYDDEPKLTANMRLERNYPLFAMLANVRNGRRPGLAGDEFAYIQEDRGVPDDISPEAKAVLSYEHSAGWVTLQELLDFDWTRRATAYGEENVRYSKAAGEFYSRWIPKLTKIATDAGCPPKHLRIVFDFDS